MLLDLTYGKDNASDSCIKKGKYPLTKLKNADYEKHSDISHLHALYVRKEIYDVFTDYEFVIYNKKTQRIDIFLNGHVWHTRQDTFEIATLSGREGNPYKCHHFYLYLMRHFKFKLTTDTQSIGGKTVWERMSCLDGVKIYAKRGKKGRERTDWLKCYTIKMSEETYLRPSYQNVKLVAELV